MNGERILVLAPVGRDGPLAQQALLAAGFFAQACGSMEELCRELRLEVGAVILTEEALFPRAATLFNEALAQQPTWSDLPLILFGSRDLTGAEAGNFTLLDRPVRLRTLLSAVRTALRARRRQYQVRDLLLAMESSVRDRDQFLAMLGHELRNPLAALVTARELIEQKAGDSFARERAVMGRQLRHLSRLVDDLLDVSRVTRGKIPLQRERVELRAFFARVLQELERPAQVQGVHLTLAPGEGEVAVLGDVLRLEQIAGNLLSNAVKYTNRGGSIRVSVEAEGGEAVVRVKDSGVGIDAAMLPRVFDLFAQAPGALDRAQGGMGIGLTLVQRLVALHGGTVRAASDGLGKGSEFTVRLPLYEGEDAPARQDGPGADRRQLRVVLAEDNADARELLQLALEQMGHRVASCDDGAEAVDRALSEKPDAMLVDLGLPGMDGFAVARAVRGALGPAVRLVALTGYGQPDDRDRALAAGFDAFLVKPAEIDAVDRALRCTG